MIPLKDDVVARTFPFVNIVLIALNAVAFVYELGLSPRRLEWFMYQAAVVPHRGLRGRLRLRLGVPQAAPPRPAPGHVVGAPA